VVRDQAQVSRPRNLPGVTDYLWGTRAAGSS
jgi:hypothetical protein